MGCSIRCQSQNRLEVAQTHTCRRCPLGPQTPRSTALIPVEVAIVVELRRTTLLPLYDILGGLRDTIPTLSRSALHRCLQRHGTARRDLSNRARPDGLLRASYASGIQKVADGKYACEDFMEDDAIEDRTYWIHATVFVQSDGFFFCNDPTPVGWSGRSFADGNNAVGGINGNNVPIQPGNRIRIVLPAGGDWRPPGERNSARVPEDYVSATQARALYGVGVDD